MLKHPLKLEEINECLEELISFVSRQSGGELGVRYSRTISSVCIDDLDKPTRIDLTFVTGETATVLLDNPPNPKFGDYTMDQLKSYILSPSMLRERILEVVEKHLYE